MSVSWSVGLVLAIEGTTTADFSFLLGALGTSDSLRFLADRVFGPGASELVLFRGMMRKKGNKSVTCSRYFDAKGHFEKAIVKVKVKENSPCDLNVR